MASEPLAPSTKMGLTDLPTDVILLLFPYLRARDFLAFTSCNKSLAQFQQEPKFWRNLTHATFRIPHQPLLEGDGRRWQWLYKNLNTQTRVYTWGNDDRGGLGHGPQGRRGEFRGYGHVGWPTPMVTADEVGSVDVQCGGWSTVLLNSIGQLSSVGTLNGLKFRQGSSAVPIQLTFPLAYPATTRDRYEPSTAIKQYSVGRSHVLGVSDAGGVWQWIDFRQPAKFIKSVSVDIVLNGSESGNGRVTRVVAGWDKSTAYVIGKGIIYWDYSILEDEENVEQADGYLIDTLIVPGTSYRRSDASRWLPDSLEARIGEVVNHVVLNRHIVFTTHLNKVFAYPILWPEVDVSVVPTELTTFCSASGDFQIQDIQGSFRRFGVFTKQGAVLLGDTDLLNAFCSPPERSLDGSTQNSPSPQIIPALQNASVISLAFGDYHFHALHVDGTITSYGEEPQHCGALGLGSARLSKLRGVRSSGHNGVLSTPEWSDGRRTIWFEPEKKDWLFNIASKGGQVGESEATMRARMVDEEQQGAHHVMAEWLEQGGRNWSSGPSNSPEDFDDGIGAYFALKVAAAGWHSAALVLVNPQKAEHVRQKYMVQPEPPEPSEPVTPNNENRNGDEAEGEEIASPGEQLQAAVGELGAAPDSATERSTERGEEDVYMWDSEPFPRLRLPGGEEMPGCVPLTAWKGSEPQMG